MLFNSANFALFLPVVFFLYWFVTHKKLSLQNLLLLVSSYFFYACWDWRFLFLLIFSTCLDYFSALKIADAEKKSARKFWFWTSILINLGFLGVFKYYNFFAQSLAESLSGLGFQINPGSLDIILPVGISFYTFHGLSYVIDVYKERIEPEKNFVTYSVFVSYFPLLVAGPIERATHLLPQIKVNRNFEYSKAVDGLRQILWGLFKKVVIADQCAEYANLAFNNTGDYSGSTLLLGSLFFTIQIYGDFSGYSDIALGVSRLFGIELLRNFAYPYFSRDIAEFWRRWHISLSSWFRDYLYFPLGGSKGGSWSRIKNTFIIFLVSGFWHGANWTFIVWGFLNALYIMPSIVMSTNRNHLEIVAKGKVFPKFSELLSMFMTFGLTVLAWIFFRAESVGHAFAYLGGIFSSDFFTVPAFAALRTFITIGFTCLMFLIEWSGREEQYGLAKIGLSRPRFLRWAFYLYLVILIVLNSGKEQEFIYFQF
jgi:alginate O-acetyltransferase complex protein AlgI